MVHILVGSLFVAIVFKYGDWRNWEKYYPTILFFWFGDILYFSLFRLHPLWLYYQPGVPHLLVELFYKLTASWSAVVLFFTFYPKPLRKQILYILLWVVMYSGIESFLMYLGYFAYFHGWSLWWSMLVDVIMFTTFKIHYHKPLWGLGIYFVCMLLLAYLFHLPFNRIS